MSVRRALRVHDSPAGGLDAETTEVLTSGPGVAATLMRESGLPKVLPSGRWGAVKTPHGRFCSRVAMVHFSKRNAIALVLLGAWVGEADVLCSYCGTPIKTGLSVLKNEGKYFHDDRKSDVKSGCYRYVTSPERVIYKEVYNGDNYSDTELDTYRVKVPAGKVVVEEEATPSDAQRRLHKTTDGDKLYGRTSIKDKNVKSGDAPAKDDTDGQEAEPKHVTVRERINAYKPPGGRRLLGRDHVDRLIRETKRAQKA